MIVTRENWRKLASFWT